MVEEKIKKEILKRIANAEKEHDVKVLYAIESGSRAWGFESPNSDYDVRFIYIHKKEHYLSIDLEDKRDVIEYEIVDEIDINGWDIRKALKLLLKSNPSLIEWLNSPIVYVKDEIFFNKMHEMLKKVYDIKRGVYHYRSMAMNNCYKNLQKEIVSLKKYFYVLRPLLAIQWIEKYGEVPPIEFDKLCKLLPSDSVILHEINMLLEQKKVSQEKELIKPNKILNNFITEELKRLENLDKNHSKISEMQLELADEIFRKFLK